MGGTECIGHIMSGRRDDGDGRARVPRMDNAITIQCLVAQFNYGPVGAY